VSERAPSLVDPSLPGAAFGPIRAVTFDCWGTLIYEPDSSVAWRVRVEALRRAAGRSGRELGPERATLALQTAWERHVDLWRENVASGAREIAGWALERLGICDDAAADALFPELAEAALQQEIRALEGARATLERLEERGIRRALVCDTGFSPGRVVRSLLDRHGLLELLEVQIFSDEAGVPKPHPSLFRAALEPLAVESGHSVHVGDLRRTDVAGGRGVGMGTVRIRGHHDDTSEHPDADAVADSHAHLRRILAID
jgi:putative hydrolase of the HAD superfamily